MRARFARPRWPSSAARRPACTYGLDEPDSARPRARVVGRGHLCRRAAGPGRSSPGPAVPREPPAHSPPDRGSRVLAVGQPDSTGHPVTTSPPASLGGLTSRDETDIMDTDTVLTRTSPIEGHHRQRGRLPARRSDHRMDRCRSRASYTDGPRPRRFAPIERIAPRGVRAAVRNRPPSRPGVCCRPRFRTPTPPSTQPALPCSSPGSPHRPEVLLDRDRGPVAPALPRVPAMPASAELVSRLRKSGWAARGHLRRRAVGARVHHVRFERGCSSGKWRRRGWLSGRRRCRSGPRAGDLRSVRLTIAGSDRAGGRTPRRGVGIAAPDFMLYTPEVGVYAHT